ncbi:MAG: aminopeptidase N [Magnetospirillum sp.]|nr:aminopeptidase N [Magnetospirillum sp.]
MSAPTAPSQRTTILRSAYAAPAYLVDSTDLRVEIGAEHVAVHAELAMRRNPAGGGGPLTLDGAGLDTRAVALDGRVLGNGEYRIEAERLTIDRVPEGPFRLATTVAIDPRRNTALSGLYRSGDMLCTQCEAEGFRRITWYPDRPDVMARFRVVIDADRNRYPVLLSNGNLVATEDLGGGRHRAVWEDPFPKPSYLFALVAGDLADVEGAFATRSGRQVALRFWVEHGNADQVGHALESLRKAMAWDEAVFGLEYDLDVYNIVAVSHFNMGAMENKSLNIFNSKYVLAKPETATDGDFLGIESVIAHEYFHNWTGNRVTCRDWFQLTLKEGLTVFRDQEFSSDMNSRAVTRIEEVRALRAGQFPEDNGPMAHPIRPESYEEINNFYTATVYQKGAEVIRMIHTLIGAEAFRKGMDLYFARHDGQAVTCEDFVAAMEDASGADLRQFRHWYSQAGTPTVSAAWSFDAAARRLRLTLGQATCPTPGQDTKPAFHVPIRMGLVGAAGNDLPLRLEGENAASGTTRVLDLTEPSHTFVFEDVGEPAVPSLLRGFSAPVTLEADWDSGTLAFLMAKDSDPFNRWEAGQTLAARTLLALIAARADGRAMALDEAFATAWGRVLADRDRDPAFTAEALALPSPTLLGERMAVIDVAGIHAARKFAHRALTARFREDLLALRNLAAEPGTVLTPGAIGRRRLRNAALGLLAQSGDSDARPLAEGQFAAAACMTDQLAALSALIDCGPDAAAPALGAFLDRWRHEGLVVNKWFALQAMADWPDVLERVQGLLSHPAYDPREPNKVYALLGGFAANFAHFHSADGAGYAFLADQVVALDSANPQIAARMVRPLIRWKRYDSSRQAAMVRELGRIAAVPNLSRDVGEIVGKALA